MESTPVQIQKKQRPEDFAIQLDCGHEIQCETATMIFLSETQKNEGKVEFLDCPSCLETVPLSYHAASMIEAYIQTNSINVEAFLKEKLEKASQSVDLPLGNIDLPLQEPRKKAGKETQRNEDPQEENKRKSSNEGEPSDEEEKETTRKEEDPENPEDQAAHQEENSSENGLLEHKIPRELDLEAEEVESREEPEEQRDSSENQEERESFQKENEPEEGLFPQKNNENEKDGPESYVEADDLVNQAGVDISLLEKEGNNPEYQETLEAFLNFLQEKYGVLESIEKIWKKWEDKAKEAEEVCTVSLDKGLGDFELWVAEVKKVIEEKTAKNKEMMKREGQKTIEKIKETKEIAKNKSEMVKRQKEEVHETMERVKKADPKNLIQFFEENHRNFEELERKIEETSKIEGENMRLSSSIEEEVDIFNQKLRKEVERMGSNREILIDLINELFDRKENPKKKPVAQLRTKTEGAEASKPKKDIPSPLAKMQSLVQGRQNSREFSEKTGDSRQSGIVLKEKKTQDPLSKREAAAPSKKTTRPFELESKGKTESKGNCERESKGEKTDRKEKYSEMPLKKEQNGKNTSQKTEKLKEKQNFFGKITEKGDSLQKSQRKPENSLETRKKEESLRPAPEIRDYSEKAPPSRDIASSSFSGISRNKQDLLPNKTKKTELQNDSAPVFISPRQPENYSRFLQTDYSGGPNPSSVSLLGETPLPKGFRIEKQNTEPADLFNIGSSNKKSKGILGISTLSQIEDLKKSRLATLERIQSKFSQVYGLLGSSCQGTSASQSVLFSEKTKPHFATMDVQTTDHQGLCRRETSPKIQSFSFARHRNELLTSEADSQGRKRRKNI